MALLFFLVLVALAWGLGALLLWPRTRRIGAVLPWLGGALALGVVACLAWGFVGILRHADWQALSNAQAVHRLFGDGTLWFIGTGWPLLDRVANIYLSLDVALTLLALCAATLRGWVFWAGVAERRRQARVRRGR
ncbi:hypothetical protein [Luteimonas sp. MC1572]|uniref:hypothetical protein n=1 Tax=Luteimonas sp. MC1572 TaxID=2799325 RepID=UPI0018F0C471|nr:hypothetical protein [Luteimonas sp. MC1572]MBJ6982010.1 hypothetical protein [Luteimonas sp. MC1572]QQO03309.1 hypothetical protein JGR64_00545 [Luteimonas sp. MC1572]